MSRWRPPPVRSLRLTRRGLLLLGAQAGIMGALAWRMRALQVEDAQRYRLLAEENRINIRLLPPARGQIFDRNGAPLAVNSQNYRVVLIREQAGDVEDTLDRLGRLIRIEPHERERVLRDIRRKSSFVPVTVTEHLDWEDFARVNANAPALPGIDVEVGLTRYYPEGLSMAHVVGYVGRVSEKELIADEGRTPLFQIPDFHIGKSGVETRREDTLRGHAGLSRIEVNARGRKVRELTREEGAPGADLQLTIDLELQRYAMDRLNGESAAVVAMDVTTGDLVACASSPGVRAQPVRLRHLHQELAGADGRPLPAAVQQDRLGALPAGLHLQDGGGAGGAGGGGRRQCRKDLLQRPLQAGGPLFPLLEPGRAWADDPSRRAGPVLRRVFLRDRAAGRGRRDFGHGASAGGGRAP